MKLIGGVVLLLIRVALGVLMVTAGAAKLGDPQTFALAIKAYDLGIPEPGLIALAYLIPWTEILTGALLLVGARPRVAAGFLFVLLAGFTYGVGSVLYRGLDVTCSCFGDQDVFCQGPISMCHVYRNSGLLVAALAVLVGGGGLLALDGDPSKPSKTEGEDGA